MKLKNAQKLFGLLGYVIVSDTSLYLTYKHVSSMATIDFYKVTQKVLVSNVKPDGKLNEAIIKQRQEFGWIYE